MNACMADGSVRPMSSDMSRTVWWALLTPAGKDIAD
jgi:hypothetical protein